MLLRLIVENIASFKNEVEFNTFPSSRTRSHNNHKIQCGHATALRLAAIYGANGAGKSNLLRVLSLLKEMVVQESLTKVSISDNLVFKFDQTKLNQPSGIAIEFYQEEYIFYYHVEFNRYEVFKEELLLSKPQKDFVIFERDKEKLVVNKEFFANGYNASFVDGLKRLVRSDMLVLSFLGNLYHLEFPIIASAYKWFITKLQIVAPEAQTGIIPHFLDVDTLFEQLVNTTIQEMNTGISQLKVKKRIIDESKVELDSKLKTVINVAKQYPGVPQPLFENLGTDVSNVVYENGNVVLKTLVAIHTDEDNRYVEMPINKESDGTRRIIEYMPLLHAIINGDAVYVVDEIERSIHPILIREIIKKLSQANNLKGQLLFTTHESALLDQDIFRPDEIWFAQKDLEQSTQLYPLSDFNIHNTANIEKGYLNGRYGGIPFS